MVKTTKINIFSLDREIFLYYTEATDKACAESKSLSVPFFSKDPTPSGHFPLFQDNFYQISTRIPKESTVSDSKLCPLDLCPFFHSVKSAKQSEPSRMNLK